MKAYCHPPGSLHLQICEPRNLDVCHRSSSRHRRGSQRRASRCVPFKHITRSPRASPPPDGLAGLAGRGRPPRGQAHSPALSPARGTAPALKAGPACSWTLCHVRPPRPLRLLGSMTVSQPFSPSRLDASGEGRSGCAWLPHGSGLPAPSPPARGLALVFCNSLARLFSPGKCELQLRTGWGKCACVQCGCARAVCVCSACAVRVQRACSVCVQRVPLCIPGDQHGGFYLFPHQGLG